MGGPVTLLTGALLVGQGGLHGTDSFVANGLLTLGAGTDLSVPAMDAYGGLTIDATTGYFPTIHGTTLNNYGAATIQTGFAYSMFLSQGATINNLAGASFTISGTGGLIVDQDNSPVALNNAGTLTCNISGGFDMSQVAVANTGSLAVQQGSLRVGGTGSTVSSGSFTGAAVTDLVISGQDLTLTSVISSAGSVHLSGCTEAGSYSVAGDTSAGSVTFTGPVQLGTSLEVGDATFAPAVGGPVTLLTGALLVGQGGLHGTDSFVANGLLTLGAGTDLSVPAMDAYGGLTIDATTGYFPTIHGTTLNNYGAATIQTGFAYSMFLSQGATINNLAGASFTISGTGGLIVDQDNSPVALNNAGTLTCNISGGFDMSQVAVANTGSLAVQQGSLRVGGTGSTVSSGSFTGAAVTDLVISGQDLTSTSVISSAGSVHLSGCTEAGSYSVAGDTSAGSVTFTGPVQLGTSLEVGDATFAPAVGGPVTLLTGALLVGQGGLHGTDSFVANGLLTLGAGTDLSVPAMDAYGGLTIDATTGYFPTIHGTTLNNYGAATIQTGFAYSMFLSQGATINNLAGASFTVSGTGGLIVDQDNSPVAFNNAGTLTCNISGGFDMSQVAVANTGSLAVQQGWFGLANVCNSGSLTVASGAAFGVGTYTQTAGSTIVNGGTINGGGLSINGGALSGTGTINAAVTNGGQVIPGGTATAGTLTINGNYTQTSTGALDIDIGGTTPGTQYDQLAVSGAAMLGGRINVSLINGFHPILGNTFQPLTFGSSTGDFGFYNGIVLGNGLFLNPTRNSTNLTLTAGPAPTMMTLAAPPSSSVSGQSVPFTAIVTVALPPTTIDPVPTGTVTFYDNGSPIGTGTLSVVSGQDEATFTTNQLTTASHTITAAYTSGDTNFVPSPASTAVTQVVNQASTSATIVTSINPSVSGQAVTITATVSVVSPGSTAVARPTGTVTFYDNGTPIGTGTLSVVSGQDQATFTTSTLSTASHPITAAYTSGDGNFNASAVSAGVTQTVNKDSTTTTAVASPSSANFGQTVTFTATVTANSPGSGTPTGTVDFYDTTTSTDLTPGGVVFSSGTATFGTTSLAVGSHVITATYSGDGNFLSSYATTSPVTVGPFIIVLDRTAGGALSLSGNASINIAGAVYVDSNSSTALAVSGNAQIKASAINVTGQVKKSGNASLSPVPVTGAPVAADPLAGVAIPVASTLGLSSKGSLSLSGNSTQTIGPGVYSKISLSGAASLTLNPGVYVITGGGFTVSGNASVSVFGPANAVTGTGVMIYNAGSGYNLATGADGGSFGAITLSGNGAIKLAPPSTGAYAGILIFQARDNPKALSVSGNALQGVTGVIYAPAAQLAESGNAQIGSTSNPISIVVHTLSASGNAIADGLTLTPPSGSVAYTPAQIRAAYGIGSIGLDGAGQTIAIVDAYDDPNIYQSLDAFDAQFGLTTSGPTLYDQYGPASSFLTVLRQSGQATNLPSTDPNGAGTDNWEVEEALDVEWAHAIAPGAQIILVEASSQSLSDLMASAAAAAAQPGVSVVSMSWGFPEGQAVFAADEAAYDSVFNVPGVTFVASTGDYGTADPEYPAFSPNVVAVGGTSLMLNADNSYNSETGWGYYSNAAGAFIASGGGISLYEPEPAYQQGVQSTGGRTTPDVSLVADPATGAWIADPYNLDPSNPFEVVGGTSLSAPAWVGLVALVNQGRAAAGESSLNSTSPTDTQQALYMLPQSDYNAIASGNNGYTASAGYNLVTGLGTPMANLLVPDLIAYQGAGTAYSGSTVAPLQNSGLVNTGSGDSGAMDVFSVFDSFTLANVGLSHAHDKGASRPEGALGHGTIAAGGADRPFVSLQPGSFVVSSAAGDGLAQPLTRPESSLNSAVDEVLGVLGDANSHDTLIGDLAFEQVSLDIRKPRGSAAI